MAMPGRATILVIDDDDSSRRILKAFLGRRGHRVLLAANGKEALDVLRAGAIPDVILLDLQMPAVSGFEVLNALRANPAWARIPTVVITASEDCSAAQLGVAAVLRKPFRDAGIQAAILMALDPFQKRTRVA